MHARYLATEDNSAGSYYPTNMGQSTPKATLANTAWLEHAMDFAVEPALNPRPFTELRRRVRWRTTCVPNRPLGTRPVPESTANESAHTNHTHDKVCRWIHCSDRHQSLLQRRVFLRPGFSPREAKPKASFCVAHAHIARWVRARALSTTGGTNRRKRCSRLHVVRFDPSSHTGTGLLPCASRRRT
jgi:hypothetical protein